MKLMSGVPVWTRLGVEGGAEPIEWLQVYAPNSFLPQVSLFPVHPQSAAAGSPAGRILSWAPAAFTLTFAPIPDSYFERVLQRQRGETGAPPAESLLSDFRRVLGSADVTLALPVNSVVPAEQQAAACEFLNLVQSSTVKTHASDASSKEPGSGSPDDGREAAKEAAPRVVSFPTPCERATSQAAEEGCATYTWDQREGGKTQSALVVGRNGTGVPFQLVRLTPSSLRTSSFGSMVAAATPPPPPPPVQSAATNGVVVAFIDLADSRPSCINIPNRRACLSSAVQTLLSSSGTADVAAVDAVPLLGEWVARTFDAEWVLLASYRPPREVPESGGMPEYVSPFVSWNFAGGDEGADRAPLLKARQSSLTWVDLPHPDEVGATVMELVPALQLVYVT